MAHVMLLSHPQSAISVTLVVKCWSCGQVVELKSQRYECTGCDVVGTFFKPPPELRDVVYYLGDYIPVVDHTTEHVSHP